MKIMQAGHPINTTFHAESSDGAIKRFQTAYLACSGNEPSHLALATITGLVNMIIVQKIMRDGKRRIIQISEVIGVDKENKEKAEINDLYRFEITGDPIYNDKGEVEEIVGKHVRVGRLSPRTIQKLKLEGVAESRFDFLDKDPDLDNPETETYTGSNIDDYGMVKR